MIKHRTEQQLIKDAIKNGYDLCQEDFANTLAYINYRLAEIREFDEKIAAMYRGQK